LGEDRSPTSTVEHVERTHPEFADPADDEPEPTELPATATATGGLQGSQALRATSRSGECALSHRAATWRRGGEPLAAYERHRTARKLGTDRGHEGHATRLPGQLLRQCRH
jgi:hypothetical protein